MCSEAPSTGQVRLRPLARLPCQCGPEHILHSRRWTHCVVCTRLHFSADSKQTRFLAHPTRSHGTSFSVVSRGWSVADERKRYASLGRVESWRLNQVSVSWAPCFRMQTTTFHGPWSCTSPVQQWCVAIQKETRAGESIQKQIRTNDVVYLVEHVHTSVDLFKDFFQRLFAELFPALFFGNSSQLPGSVGGPLWIDLSVLITHVVQTLCSS